MEQNLVTTLNSNKFKLLKNSVETATKALFENQVICFATETVYALACNAQSDLAVSRLYEIKKRNPNKPLGIFVKNLTLAEEFLNFNQVERKIAKNFMPGMITLVLERKKIANQNITISSLINNQEDNLGLRIPNHDFCLKLLESFNGVVAATSANISQEKPATSFIQAKNYFKDQINLIIDGGECKNKIASTVLRVKNNQIIILREGLITKDQIKSCL